MKTQDAIQYFGTKAELARQLGIYRSAITHWGSQVPKGRAYQIEVITNGLLKAEPEDEHDAAQGTTPPTP